MSGGTNRDEDSAAKRLLPDTLRPRELLALPVYVLTVALYVASACLGFVADAIAGKPHSLQMFDWRRS